MDGYPVGSIVTVARRVGFFRVKKHRDAEGVINVWGPLVHDPEHDRWLSDKTAQMITRPPTHLTIHYSPEEVSDAA